MKVPLRHALPALLACALCTLGAAPARTPPAPGTPRPVGPTGIVLPAADPMATEMQRELERGQREYAALFQRLALAHGEDEAFGIQEDMRQQRTGMQVALLRIQAAYARRAGRNVLAAQLERAVEALIAAEPKAPAGPDGHARM